MQSVKNILLASVSLLAGSLSLQAELKTYDFKDPKGVNNVSFLLDAPLESISGNAKGVSGIVTFDSTNPKAVSGAITIETGSLTATNNKLQEHMLGDAWLDAASHPEITFVAKSISKLEELKDGFKAQLTGDFTLKGVTKELTVPVTFTHLPDMLGKRSNGAMEGDLLVLRSTFTIHRSDYGIKPGQHSDKVAEVIELRLAIAGAAPDA